ncbi:RBBP9/YdeN family alpha/beta hydrolase [Methylovirgula sp. 4M-Z18]|uniref:RBBP9/YdeN family alpha/beta hydrolase n=1 Tax=Methylovirgula sp. 4M-Z18 TaxID=2293567 RepID=UPI000E2EAB4C|nr:alpha/beta hydrolase [Methylovirgula sp. 4M-Z18]RFB78953.1 alpha/beta hydrolase [Methylovirgula sp. 4M-Z18]
MRTSDADILIIPGWGGSGPDHWQSRWQQKLKTAQRVEQGDWDLPHQEEWTQKLIDTAKACTRPVVLVAHSLGVLVVTHAVPRLPDNVIGAFLVAPPDLRGTWVREVLPDAMVFDPTPHGKIPFHAHLIASSNDPYCTLAAAEHMATSWGATFANAGEAGHINTESGHGPWPEGLMSFGGFLGRL